MSRQNALWTLDEIRDATGGRLEGAGDIVACAPDQGVTGISIDSRAIAPGHAYFAITGDRLDGHDFVGAALEAGAALAVISEARAPDFSGGSGLRLVVPDVLGALEDLGRAARARMGGKVIAITGSVGKTGTKEALRLALTPSGRVHAADKSFNNHWGVPLTLARMPRDTEFGIFEIGMNHPGEIRPLVKMVRPHIAVITIVAPVHLEFFPSVVEIARAKAEIFEGVEPGGVVLLNADNPHFGLLRDLAAARPEIAEIASFGCADFADIRLLDAVVEAGHSTVTASLFGTEVTYRVGAPGQHQVANSLAVIGAAQRAGGDVKAACAALAELTAPIGRGARRALVVDGGKAVLIDESYNANPASMRAALDLLGQTVPNGKGRRIAVLGDMLELGEAGAGLHGDLAEPIAANCVDRVFCCGPLMGALWDRLPQDRKAGYAPKSEELVGDVVAGLRGGDVVMVKGSLGSRMGPLVDALLTIYGADKSNGEKCQG